MSEDTAVGSIARGHESGLPMSLREGQTVESRVAIVEVVLEERHRLYLQLFQSQEAAFLESVRAAREAIQKADVAAEKRFASVNEFRAQLNDVITTLMPRSESTSRYQALTEKVDTMQTRIDRSEGSGLGLKQGWMILVGAVAALAAGVTISAALSKPAPQVAENAGRLEEMSARLNALSGRLNSVQSQPPAK